MRNPNLVSLDDIDRLMEVPVIGQQHAPNLMLYLESHNIEIANGPADRAAAIDAVTIGTFDVVVVVPPNFGEQLAETIPAQVELIFDQANSQAERNARRVRSALYSYSQELAVIRLVARGVSPIVMRPINVD